jgi:hypothetical protein
LPHKASTPQIRQNHGLQKVAPLRFAHCHRFSKYLLCPFNRTGYQVLPDFTRSELQKKDKRQQETRIKKKRYKEIKNAGKGLTEKRAWVFCL